MAATKLLESLSISRDSIDALVFVTQSPDYFCPASACYLHGQLGLSQTCLSFDINQACAGYLYGLYVAHSLCDSGAANRVLLIVGDTLSKFVNPLDSNLAPMMGDGVSATLLERSDLTYNNGVYSSPTQSHKENSKTCFIADSKNIKPKNLIKWKIHKNFDAAQTTKAYFELGSDGSKFYQLIIPEGACRVPTQEIITDPKIWQTNETRGLKDLYMDGAEIFSFAVSTYPKTFQSLLDYAQCDKDTIDYFFFHQANKYIVDNIMRSLGLQKEKVPNTTTNRYGNLSGCSIPATICDTLAPFADNGLDSALRVHLAGFRAGLAWGNALVTLDRGFRCQKVGIYE